MRLAAIAQMENRTNEQRRTYKPAADGSNKVVKPKNLSNNGASLQKNGEQRLTRTRPVASRSFKVTTRKKEEKKPFPFATVFTTAAFTLLFLFMMLNYVELDKYNSQISELKSEMTDLKTEEDKLRVKLERRDDLAYIEEYASNQLGMVKADELETYYVDIKAEDKADIITYDDGKESGIGVLLSGVGQTIRSFFGS